MDATPYQDWTPPAWVVALADQRQAQLTELVDALPTVLAGIKHIVVPLTDTPLDHDQCDNCHRRLDGEDINSFVLGEYSTHVRHVHIDMLVASCLECSGLNTEKD